MKNKKIILGSDHAGFELKEEIKKYLVKSGHHVEDKGAHKFDPKDDYPKFILSAAKAVATEIFTPVATTYLTLGLASYLCPFVPK